MAFTYDSNALAAVLNHLRFLVQDTIDEGHLFEDAEISFAAAQETNIYRAAAGLCRVAATKVLQDPGIDQEVKYDPDEKAKTYLKLAESYDKKADEADESLSTPGDAGLNLPSLPNTPAAFTRDLHFS